MFLICPNPLVYEDWSKNVKFAESMKIAKQWAQQLTGAYPDLCIYQQKLQQVVIKPAETAFYEHKENGEILPCA